jgi:hypothetical protein
MSHNNPLAALAGQFNKQILQSPPYHMFEIYPRSNDVILKLVKIITTIGVMIASKMYHQRFNPIQHY